MLHLLMHAHGTPLVAMLMCLWMACRVHHNQRAGPGHARDGQGAPSSTYMYSIYMYCWCIHTSCECQCTMALIDVSVHDRFAATGSHVCHFVLACLFEGGSGMCTGVWHAQQLRHRMDRAITVALSRSRRRIWLKGTTVNCRIPARRSSRAWWSRWTPTTTASWTSPSS